MTTPAEVGLKRFKKEDILITREGARKILIFFFGSNVPPSDNLTDEDVSFAQALLLEAVDKSYAMSYVQAVFDTFYMKIPTDIGEMIKDFAKKAAKNWFDHATGRDLSKPHIYHNVRVMITANFRETWQMR